MTDDGDPTVRVRPAHRGDADAIRTIDDLTRSPSVSPADPVAPGDVVDPFATHGPGDVRVAELARRVVGYVVLGQPTSLRANAHVVAIEGLAVHPRVQGRGVGHRLVDAAVAEARRRGARRLTLRVLAGNTAARALYTSAGFVVEGVLVGEFVLDGVAVDDVLMARALDSAGAVAGE